MGALFEEVWSGGVNQHGGINPARMWWMVNIPVNLTATQVANRIARRSTENDRPRWDKQWKAAYWYLVHAHHVSFQSSGQLLGCSVPSGMLHRERIRRSMQEKDRKWRRDKKNLLK